MTRATIDYAAKVRTHWGEDAPEEVLALADECRRTSQTKAGARIGIAGSTVSQILSRSYPGDMQGMLDRAGVLLIEREVECPVLGTITRASCTRWQSMGFAASDSTRVAVFHACRGGCVHARPSLIERADARGEAA